MTELSPSSLLNDNLTSPAKVLPEECVDYLSFNFDAFDLHKCWRNATKHKDNIVNGRRLENASWRKFFQMRFGLPTIDPAKLNWFVVHFFFAIPHFILPPNRQKDSDVVWLYGPFAGLHQYEPLAVIQKAAEEFGSETELKSTTLKPALKKRPEPNDFLQQLRELYVKTRSTGLLTDEQPITIPNSNREDSFLVPPTGNRPEFSFSANKSVSRRNKTDTMEPTFTQILHSGNGTPPLKNITFLDDDVQFSLSIGSEQQNRHIRFNESVEQARIIDEETEVSPVNKQVRKVPSKPSSPKLLKKKAFLIGLDDEDEEDDDEDFENAGAANVFGAVPARRVNNYNDPIPININPSAFPSVQTAHFYAQSPVYSRNNSLTPSGSISSHTHVNVDEFDAVTGAVAGSTDWMGTSGQGSGLLRRTQSEGNNFYVMARRLAETAPTPPVSNYSSSPAPSIRTASRTPSLRSSVSQAPPPPQKAPSLPRIGSGLLPIAQLPPAALKSDDEESEDDTSYLNSKLAFAAQAHHRGSPPPKLGLRSVESESESESESEEEGLILGISGKRLVNTTMVEKNIQTNNDEDLKLSQYSSPPNTSTTMTSSLVRTSSWIASTYPSSAKSFGQLLYGPDVEATIERKLVSNNGDIDSDLDEEHMKMILEGATADVDKELETDLEDGFRSMETESESAPDTHKNFGDVVGEVFGNVTRWASG
ncbi:hypothetical protein HK096_004546, partial [Nowakowskiella sp. JEL0078]